MGEPPSGGEEARRAVALRERNIPQVATAPADTSPGSGSPPPFASRRRRWRTANTDRVADKATRYYEGRPLRAEEAPGTALLRRRGSPGCNAGFSTARTVL